MTSETLTSMYYLSFNDLYQGGADEAMERAPWGMKSRKLECRAQTTHCQIRGCMRGETTPRASPNVSNSTLSHRLLQSRKLISPSGFMGKQKKGYRLFSSMCYKWVTLENPHKTLTMADLQAWIGCEPSEYEKFCFSKHISRKPESLRKAAARSMTSTSASSLQPPALTHPLSSQQQQERRRQCTSEQDEGTNEQGSCRSVASKVPLHADQEERKPAPSTLSRPSQPLPSLSLDLMQPPCTSMTQQQPPGTQLQSKSAISPSLYSTKITQVTLSPKPITRPFSLPAKPCSPRARRENVLARKIPTTNSSEATPADTSTHSVLPPRIDELQAADQEPKDDTTTAGAAGRQQVHRGLNRYASLRSAGIPVTGMRS
ncbi:hypothetical protein MRB53_041731 [Persea americana]|nr:hypothetical protein MRB53_041731 [Persea americana]